MNRYIIIKFLNVFLVMNLFLSSVAYAEIIKATNAKSVETVLSKVDNDTLVIFDVADVLLTSKDQILNVHNKKYKKKLKQDLRESMSKADAEILFSIINEERENGPVNPNMVRLISNLQLKGVKVLGLTSCFTGRLGNIEYLEDWRLKELKRNNYHFEKSWSSFETKTFENLESLDADANAPVFKDGVIFASRVPKGKILEAFLNYFKLRPKNIIFIDNTMKNIESVESFAKAHEIPFIGIEYTEVINKKAKPLNKRRADYQFEILKKEKRWLSDVEADKSRAKI